MADVEAEPAPAPHREDRSGAMADARKKLRGAGRAIEAHTEARLRLQTGRNQAAARTLSRLGKLKDRPPTREPVKELKSAPDLFGETVQPQQPEVWGDVSDLRRGSPEHGRVSTPDLGFGETNRLQRLELASRQESFRPAAAGGDPAGRDARPRELREEREFRQNAILAAQEAALGRKGLLPRAGLRTKATHKNLSKLKSQTKGYSKRARRTLAKTTLDDAWRREQADLAVELRQGDDDTMILPGDEMSMASFWWDEGADAKQSSNEQSAMLVDVSHARKPAPAQVYTLRPMLSQSELNKYWKRPKPGAKPPAGLERVSSYDAAGASMALKRENNMTQIHRIRVRNEQIKGSLLRSYDPPPKKPPPPSSPDYHPVAPRAAAGRSRDDLRNPQLWDDLSPLPLRSPFPSLQDEWWPTDADNESLPPLTFRTSAGTSRGSMGLVSRGSIGGGGGSRRGSNAGSRRGSNAGSRSGTPQRKKSDEKVDISGRPLKSREGARSREGVRSRDGVRSREGMKSREGMVRSRDGLRSREGLRPSLSREGPSAMAGNNQSGSRRRKSEARKSRGPTGSRSEASIGSSDAFVGTDARLDFFQLYNDDRLTHDREGTAKPPDSARRVFLDGCYNSQTLPMPLLIARDAAQNKQVDLSHYKMDDKLAVNFATALPKLANQGVQIETLLLCHNPFEETGIRAIAGALGSCMHLMRLDLSGCNLSSDAVELSQEGYVSGSVALGAVLKEHPTIEALSLSKTRLNDRDATELLKELEAHRTLNELDLSGNSLGSDKNNEFALAMAEFITNRPEGIIPALRKLSLGWNAIRGTAAEILTAALKDSGRGPTRLERLSLTWNNLGVVGGAALGDALRTNTVLQWLDLEHTELEERGTMVIADAMKENTSMRTLILDNNPIGRLGGRAVLRAMIARRADTSRTQTPNLFRISGCTLLPPVVKSSSATELPLVYASLNQATFDTYTPGGTWLCRLNNPYERVVANELVALGWSEDGENWQDEKLDGAPFEVPEPPDGSVWERANPSAFQLPEEGELQVTYHCTRLPPTSLDVLHSEMMRSLVTLLREVLMVQGPEAALAVLQLAEYEMYFTAENAAFVVQLFEDTAHRAAAAAALFHRIVDSINWSTEFLDRMTAHEIRLMQSQLGHLFHFVPTNPTGHHRLNMYNQYDSILIRKLVSLSWADARYRMENNMIDTSQNGGYGGIRNLKLDGRSYRLKNNDSSYLPTTGIIELDFVSTNLSSRFAMTPAMPAAVFKGLCYALRRTDFSIRVKKRKPFRDQDTLLSLNFKWAAENLEELDYSLAMHSSVKIQARYRCYRKYRQHTTEACLRRTNEERQLRTDRHLTVSSSRLAAQVHEAEEGKNDFFVRIVTKMQARFRGKQTRLWMERVSNSTKDHTRTELNELAAKAYAVRGHAPRAHRQCWYIPTDAAEAIEAHSDEDRIRHGMRQRLAMLRRATSEFVFSTKQVRILLTSGTIDQSAAVDLVVLAFAGLPDPENLQTSVLSLLKGHEVVEVRSRLGWANVLNPFLVDGHHTFEFKYHDHRIVCAVLFQAAAEPGLNWQNGTFATASNPNKSGMDVPASWEIELPRRDIFEADYNTNDRCLDLSIRCRLARRLLMPGKGRWHCVPKAQLQLDVSKTYLKHETDELDMDEVDGLHPDREGAQKCPVNAPASDTRQLHGIAPTIEQIERLYDLPVEAEDEDGSWAIGDDGVLEKVPGGWEMQQWVIGEKHWLPGNLHALLGHAPASTDIEVVDSRPNTSPRTAEG